jgi:hypothetical protein
MTRRLVPAALVAAAVAMMACSSDQSTNTTVTPLTSAQLALHFDTLAGQLPVGDIRLGWYQEMDRILALGVSPAAAQMHLGGGPTVLETATEIDAFADSVNGQKVADSTYRLAGWFPSTRPTQFLDMRVRFLPAGAGNPDTIATYITWYADTAGHNTFTDSTEKVVLTVLSSRGVCQVTALQHLTVPPNPCTHITVDWLVGGGTNLLDINPQAQVSGTYLTQ